MSEQDEQPEEQAAEMSEAEAAMRKREMIEGDPRMRQPKIAERGQTDPRVARPR